jgi:hypothetical protein
MLEQRSPGRAAGKGSLCFSRLALTQEAAAGL